MFNTYVGLNRDYAVGLVGAEATQGDSMEGD